MSILRLPTNVRVPTLLDDAQAEYIAGNLTFEDFEQTVDRLLQDGTADDVSPYHGIGTVGEWR